MQKIGMIIINYNDSKTTKKLLENVKDYNVINKIVIVDNKSTDNSVKELEKYKSSKVTILVNEENNGYASAINLGSKYLIDLYKECYIIVSNSDIVIHKESDIKKLINHFAMKDIAIVAPTINEHGKIKRCWKLCSANSTILVNIPLINRLYKKNILEYKEDYFNKNYSIVDVIHGSFFIIDSKILKKVNYFDEKTFLYYEENIMARKLQVINKKSLVDNTVIVDHEHSVSINKKYSELNKYKILKQSQEYYMQEYNNANKLQMSILKFFNKVNEFFYKFR